MSDKTMETENAQLLQLVSENSSKLDHITEQLNQLISRFEDFARLPQQQDSQIVSSPEPASNASTEAANDEAPNNQALLESFLSLDTDTDDTDTDATSDVDADDSEPEVTKLEEESPFEGLAASILEQDASTAEQDSQPTSDADNSDEVALDAVDSDADASGNSDELNEALSFLDSLVRKDGDETDDAADNIAELTAETAETEQASPDEENFSPETTASELEEVFIGAESDDSNGSSDATSADDAEQSIESVRSMLAGLLEESDDESEQQETEQSQPELTSGIASASEIATPPEMEDEPTDSLLATESIDEAISATDEKPATDEKKESEFSGVTSFLDKFKNDEFSTENSSNSDAESIDPETKTDESNPTTPAVELSTSEEEFVPTASTEENAEPVDTSNESALEDDSELEAMRKELEEKLRTAEIQMSIERARISQKAAELEEKQLVLERKERAISNAAESKKDGDPQASRWSRHMSASRKKDG